MRMDKLLFTLRLLVALALICGIACLALDAQAAMQVKIVQARGGLRVREAPTTEAKAIYLLDDATTVVVLEECNGWYRVAFNSPPHAELGWVFGDYLN